MKTHLRSTHRWICFFGPDSGAPVGGDTPPAPIETAAPAVEAGPLDYKACLLDTFSLPADATDAQITEKQTEVKGLLGTLPDLQTQASSAEQLQTQLDEVQGQYRDLNIKQEELYKQQREAEADEILKVYQDNFIDDASKAAIRTILLNDKDAGIAILNGLKKPEAAAPVVTAPATGGEPAAAKTTPATPPAPTHDPAANAAAATEQEKAAKISTRARELMKSKTPKISLTKAYQLAEAELAQTK